MRKSNAKEKNCIKSISLKRSYVSREYEMQPLKCLETRRYYNLYPGQYFLRSIHIIIYRAISF
jgi:hypothetical protein